jgi:peroxin-13
LSLLTYLAEQFGNLKDTLGSIFGIFTLMKYLRIAIAKLRGKPLPPEEEITPESFNTFTNPNDPTPPPPTNRKPLIIFLLALFGLPYLMGKLIRGLAYAQSHSLSHAAPFDPSTVELFRATFDFLPQNAAAEVPLRRGDVVGVVARAEGGWWRVRLRDGREGYVPASYLEGVHKPSRVLPIMSPPGEKGHAFIEEFKDE